MITPVETRLYRRLFRLLFRSRLFNRPVVWKAKRSKRVPGLPVLEEFNARNRHAAMAHDLLDREGRAPASPNLVNNV
jgi:hypothetical protein